MRFLSCRDEESIRIDEHEHTERRALLTACGPLASEATSGADPKPVKLRVFSLSELESATGRFAKTSLLGKGSHGCLYRGTLKDGRIVSIKRQEFLPDEAAFNNELEILSTLHGPRFVNLVGFSRGLVAQDKLLVVDYMANGTLHDILHLSSCTSIAAASAAGGPLGWSMRVQIAMQTAKALLALHSATPPVIHRDVKSSSVFIDGKWNAKLGDFGLALRGHTEDGHGITGPNGEPTAAVGYMDPEDDENPGSRISTKVDVFSFGILLLEILSGRNAIDVRFKPPSIIDWALPLIKQGKAHAVYDRRLILLPQYSKALRLLAGIAARCVRRSSLRRPSMSYVVAALQDVCRKIPLAKWSGGLATVMKMTTSGCQNPNVLRDVRASPDLNNAGAVMRGPRTVPHIGKPRLAVDRPLPSGKALPLPLPPVAERAALEQLQQHAQQQKPNYYYYGNETLSKFVGRANSMDKLANETLSKFVGRAHSMDRLASFRLREERERIMAQKIAHRRPLSRQQEERESEDEDEDEEEDEEKEEETAAAKELPRALMEVSLGGRKRVYNQWRNPMFEVETRSPERPLVLPVNDVCSKPISTTSKRTITGHRRGSLSEGAIPKVRFDEGEEGRSFAAGGGVVPRPITTMTVSRRAVAPREEGSTCLPTLALSNKVRSKNVRSSSRKSHIKTRDNFEREEAMLPW